ncbi:SseB family protein [Motilibacter deserti]|uniref:SseB family protein n=1 Tax=Motilibacter deserti TaxID=2714956 RepID=A0ABX0GTF1_9ACTN|nr:SseB family protein [Motilibacter deserti]NHC12935.1 SseB family protein [Motilibacter deserti]
MSGRETVRVQVNEPLRAALAVVDAGGVAAALHRGQVLVPTTAKQGLIAPLVATDAGGRRLLPAFSGPDALQAWGAADRAGSVPGKDLVDLAAAQGVVGVLFDPAGPNPVEVGLQELSLALDGLATGPDGVTRTSEPLRARAADDVPPRLLDALLACPLPPGAELWVFERAAHGRPLLTVALGGASVTSSSAQRIAEYLGATPGLPTVDLITLDEGVLRQLADQVPAARVR